MPKSRTAFLSEKSDKVLPKHVQLVLRETIRRAFLKASHQCSHIDEQTSKANVSLISRWERHLFSVTTDEQSDVDLILLLDLACKRQEDHAPIPGG